MSLGKIFLSHSSSDKTYVSYIAEYFGKDRCVYDEMCFEAGMKNLDEILKLLQQTDIFVWFISQHSLESDWVKREFSEANLLHYRIERMRQIFPIIIDEEIEYKDDRIPDFIREGFDSYNLQYIQSNRIACKKIQAQYLKRMFEADQTSKNSHLLYYGRDEEIYALKKAYDCGQKMKCIVASGIEGIGRRSYVIHALHNLGIFPEYYIPFSITLNKDDQIEDLIIKLSNLGFGEYKLPQIVALSSFDDKIEILASLFLEIQKQKEHVMIYDHMAIIPFSGEAKYWFVKALENLRPEITISVLSTVEFGFSYKNKHKEFFNISIKELPYSEWNGLLRIYSEWIGCPFDADDRAFFKDILTGYPPQVILCADLAKEHGVQYAKDNANEIIRKVSYKVVDLLSVVFTDTEREEGYQLLAFLSQYGTMPMKVVWDAIKIHPNYKILLARLKALTICRMVGVYGEYLEVSPLIADYIQRNDFQISPLIQNYLKAQFVEFYNNTDKMEEEDFEVLKYNLREALKEGKEVPNNFLYATVYLMSVRELYDCAKYRRVIEIVKLLKINNSFSRFDKSAQNQLQRYYCLALAREIDYKFYEEVEWYKLQTPFNTVEYDFLRGFMFRQKGDFGKAIERYKKILSVRHNHRRALREIVASYRGMEDYENFGDYAEMNFNNDPENPYNIQPYFEFLLQKRDKSEEECQQLDKMILTIDNLHRIRPISAYYELNAQYAMFMEHDFDKSFFFLDEGDRNFPDSPYILRTYFDFYEVRKDLKGMERILKKLKVCADKNRSSMISYQRRNIIYQAYQGKTKSVLEHQVHLIENLSDTVKNKLINKIAKISKI